MRKRKIGFEVLSDVGVKFLQMISQVVGSGKRLVADEAREPHPGGSVVVVPPLVIRQLRLRDEALPANRTLVNRLVSLELKDKMKKLGVSLGPHFGPKLKLISEC